MKDKFTKEIELKTRGIKETETSLKKISDDLSELAKKVPDTYKRAFSDLDKLFEKLEKEQEKLNKLNAEDLDRRTKKYRHAATQYKTEIAALNNVIKLKKNILELEKQQKSLQEEQKRKEQNLENIRSQQRQEWSKGRETTYQKYLKYKGIEGFGKLGSDIVSKISEGKVSKIDAQISEQEESIAKKQSLFEGLSKEAQQGAEGLKLQEEITAGKENINLLKDQKAQTIGTTATIVNKITSSMQFFSKILNTFTIPSFKALNEGIVKVIQEFSNLKSGIATYNTATSLITNRDAREQQITYGLTSAQNFAFTQAKQILNMTNDEDLMYMNPRQRDKFLEYMEKYSQWYSKMESSGLLERVQEMQLQFEDLKRELGMEFLSWIASNKDTILTAVKGIFEVIKIIANAVMAILNLIPGSNVNSSLVSNSLGLSSGNRTVSLYTNTTNNNNFSNSLDVDTFNKGQENVYKNAVLPFLN